MQEARERLEKFRKQHQSEEIKSTEAQDDNNEHADSPMPASNSTGILSLLDIDLLDSAPFRLWRRCYEADSTKTLVITLLLYVIGQAFFLWVQFGAVYFVFSVLIAICLSLGKRNSNEVSAYSVFNPQCKRLLGQMTAEHFERDVLMKKVR